MSTAPPSVVVVTAVVKLNKTRRANCDKNGPICPFNPYLIQIVSHIRVLPKAVLTLSAYRLDLDNREGPRCPSMFVYQ